MGLCLSRSRYYSESLVNENAWQNWDRHRAREFYKIGRLLGKGAFSSVCTLCGVAAVSASLGSLVQHICVVKQTSANATLLPSDALQVAMAGT